MLDKIIKALDVFKGWKTIVGSTGVALSFIAGLFGKAISAGDIQEIINLTVEHWEFVISGTITWFGVVAAKWREMFPEE